jgi:hypothetical protein
MTDLESEFDHVERSSDVDFPSSLHDSNVFIAGKMGECARAVIWTGTDHWKSRSC